MGGEEFAVLLPEADEKEAMIAAERMREKVGEAFEDRPVPLTISFGISAYPRHGETWEQLMHSADQALYAAKALGRDRSVIFSDEVDAILERGILE